MLECVFLTFSGNNNSSVSALYTLKPLNHIMVEPTFLICISFSTISRPVSGSVFGSYRGKSIGPMEVNSAIVDGRLAIHHEMKRHTVVIVGMAMETNTAGSRPNQSEGNVISGIICNPTIGTFCPN